MMAPFISSQKRQKQQPNRVHQPRNQPTNNQSEKTIQAQMSNIYYKTTKPTQKDSNSRSTKKFRNKSEVINRATKPKGEKSKRSPEQESQIDEAESEEEEQNTTTKRNHKEETREQPFPEKKCRKKIIK